MHIHPTTVSALHRNKRSARVHLDDRPTHIHLRPTACHRRFLTRLNERGAHHLEAAGDLLPAPAEPGAMVDVVTPRR